MATLINGNGNPRIYAAQDADLIAALAGDITGIAQIGNKFAATAVDANTISVADGVIVTKEGRRIQLDAGSTDMFVIPTGTTGVTNYYIIGYKLTTQSDDSQIAETFVQLMSSSSETITEDTFRSGATDVYVSLYRVQQNGVNLGTITGLLPELTNISELKSDLYKDYVMVTGNGVKTATTLLGELWALLDTSKVTDTSYIEFQRESDRLIFEIGYEGTAALRYGHFTVNQLESLNLGVGNSYIRIEIGGDGHVIYSDKSQDVIESGRTFKLYY